MELKHVVSATCACMLSCTALAEVITVDDDLQDHPEAQFTTINAAIVAAETNDTIAVYPGVYTEDAGEAVVNFASKGVRVLSVLGPELTIIDGEYDRQCAIMMYGDAGAQLDGFTLRNGRGDNGAAIFIYETAAPEISNCLIMDCGSSYTSGILVAQCNPIISDCTITGNEFGPALRMVYPGDTPTVRGCTFCMPTGWPADIITGTIEDGGGNCFVIGCEDNDLNGTPDLCDQSHQVLHVPGDYDTLSSAVNAADWGATIRVHGTYSGQDSYVSIPKSLTIEGDSGTLTRINERLSGSAGLLQIQSVKLQPQPSWNETRCISFSGNRLVIKDSVISGGTTTNTGCGGGLTVWGATVELHRVMMRENVYQVQYYAGDGGTHICIGGGWAGDPSNVVFVDHCSFLNGISGLTHPFLGVTAAAPAILMLDSGGLLDIRDSTFCANLGSETFGDVMFLAPDGSLPVNSNYYSESMYYDLCCPPDDCDCSGVADVLELSADTDCDSNGLLDTCEFLESAESIDCNGNGLIDVCEIDAHGDTLDCDANGILDSCDSPVGGDCNGNGLSDICEVMSGMVADINNNLVPDECDIAFGLEADCDENSVLDRFQSPRPRCAVGQQSLPTAVIDGVDVAWNDACVVSHARGGGVFAVRAGSQADHNLCMWNTVACAGDAAPVTLGLDYSDAWGAWCGPELDLEGEPTVTYRDGVAFVSGSPQQAGLCIEPIAIPADGSIHEANPMAGIEFGSWVVAGPGQPVGPGDPSACYQSYGIGPETQWPISLASGALHTRARKGPVGAGVGGPLSNVRTRVGSTVGDGSGGYPGIDAVEPAGALIGRPFSFDLDGNGLGDLLIPELTAGTLRVLLADELDMGDPGQDPNGDDLPGGVIWRPATADVPIQYTDSAWGDVRGVVAGHLLSDEATHVIIGTGEGRIWSMRVLANGALSAATLLIDVQAWFADATGPDTIVEILAIDVGQFVGANRPDLLISFRIEVNSVPLGGWLVFETGVGESGVAFNTGWAEAQQPTSISTGRIAPTVGGTGRERGIVMFDGQPKLLSSRWAGCAADVIKDGQINIEDLLHILATYGSSDETGDVDRSGTVNIDDLLIFMADWGSDCSL